MTGVVPLPGYLTALAVLGLAIGSFLNVVVHRVPAALSLVSPGSACPACAHPVRPRDNVPVLSWLLLRGRCRDCATPISGRYPLVEATTAVLFLAVGLRLEPSGLLAAVLALTAAGVALFLIDLDHGRLPFPVTGTAAALVAAGLTTDAVLGGTEPLPRALLSAGLWLAVYGGIWLVTAGRGMGLGDVALAPVLGLALGWVGWPASLVALAAGFLLGALVGVGLLLTGRAHRGSRVPHGPFLLTGAALGLFSGAPLAQTYLALVGLG